MKVLKKGTGQKGWAKEFTCTGSGNGMGGCGAKLLVEAGDLFHTHAHDYGGGHDIYTTFECAECGVKTDISHPAGVSGIPNSHTAWKSRQRQQRDDGIEGIEEAQNKSQPIVGRFA